MHPVQSLWQIRTRSGELDQKRVIERSDNCPCISHCSIQADSKSSCGTIAQNFPVVRSKIFLRIFSCDPALNGTTISGDSVLGGYSDFLSVQRFVHCNQYLGPHDVNSGNLFGDGVLDLNARIHFNKKPLISVLVQKEFDGSGIIISNLARKFHTRITKAVHHLFRQPNRRCHLHHFLVSSLDRTVTLMQMNDIALSISQNLDFQMLGPPHIPFQKYRRIPKSPFGFALGFFKHWL